MIRIALLMLALSINGYASAEEEAPPPPLDPKFMGSHDFVLMASESDLFASFRAEYRSPRDHQLIYMVDGKGPNLFYLVRDADLVTAKSSQFNLERLFRGETVEVTLNVYMGDHEEGASIVYPDLPVNFVKLLYHRPLDNIEPSGLRQTYDIVDLNREDRLLIHRIKHNPSFDHIVLAEEAKNCVTQFFASEAVPSENALLMKLLFCGSLKPLHYNSVRYQ